MFLLSKYESVFYFQITLKWVLLLYLFELYSYVYHILLLVCYYFLGKIFSRSQRNSIEARPTLLYFQN